MGFFDLFRRKKKPKLGISSDQFKKGRVQLGLPVPVLPSLQVSPELRSLSSKLHVIAEVDQRSFPPIPHPIYRACRTPNASTVALSHPPTPSRDTYSVTVHPRPRKQPSCIPDAAANLPPPLPLLQPRSSKTSTTLQRLYDDPSILSLIAMYDNEGRPTSCLYKSDTRPQSELLDASSLKTVSSDSDRVDIDASCHFEEPHDELDKDASEISGVRRQASKLRLLLTGHEDARVPSANADDSGDIIDWMEKQIGIYDEQEPRFAAVSTSDSPASITTVLDRPSIPQENSIDDDSAGFVSISNASYGLSVNDSPFPAKSKRASQLFQFLVKKKRSSGAEEPQRASEDDGLQLLDSFPDLPFHARSLSSRDSYRLFHLPGRPKNRERNYEQLSPVTEADYPPTPEDLGAEDTADTSLPLDIPPVRLVHRKPPSYDIYMDESIPRYMKPELAGIPTTLIESPGSQGTRRALTVIPPGFPSTPTRSSISPKPALTATFMDANDENNPFISQVTGVSTSKVNRRKSMFIGLRRSGSSSTQQI